MQTRPPQHPWTSQVFTPFRAWRKLAWVVAALLLAAPAWAEYPDRPIKLVIPFAPGGATDVIGRTLATSLSKGLGQQVVVDNKPGAGGVLAASLVAKAPADGYTLLMASIGLMSISPNLRAETAYDPRTSFAPVSQVSITPNLIVAHPSLPASDLRGLIAYAKANPMAVSYASSGPATSTHLSGELLQAMTGIRMVHVPYKGGAPALNDLLAGQVPLMFDTMSAVPHIRQGKLKVLAVTSDRRTPLLPDVPTVAEAGVPGYRVTTWNGIVAPAGTPADVVSRLNREINQALASKEVQNSLTADGSLARGGAPEEFGRFIADETARWGKLIREAGIKAAE